LKVYSASGFAARGESLPVKDNPREWMVWHFTHIDNLESICQAGSLGCASQVDGVTNVANPGIKDRRAIRVVAPDDAYPDSVVNDHVPFYIAAKSPMLFVVTKGHEFYDGGAGPLVMLGAAMGDVVDAGLTWCVSNANAAAEMTTFTRDMSKIGDFVDFGLLKQRDWYNTFNDGNRKSRRAAELLVLDELPLELVSEVATLTQTTLDRARAAFRDVPGPRQYAVRPELYY
jgi:hypothetical protein